MLTYKIKSGQAMCSWPKPAFVAVILSAVVFVALRRTPERDGYFLTTSDPPPQSRVFLISNRAHPVLAGCVGPLLTVK